MIVVVKATEELDLQKAHVNPVNQVATVSRKTINLQRDKGSLNKAGFTPVKCYSPASTQSSEYVLLNPVEDGVK